MNVRAARSNGRKKRVAIVAENSLLIEAIGIGLSRHAAFDLLGRASPKPAAVHRIIELQPDVVLVDDVNGSDQVVELVGQIKAADQRIVVLVLTTFMESSSLEPVFEAGASGAISKSTHPAALATLIRETINGRIIQVPERAYSNVPETPAARETPTTSLTARELEVLRLLAGGSTNGEIAQNLWVTTQTVKFHLSNVYRKLKVGNRTEATHYAHVNGLIHQVEHDRVE